MIEPIFVT